MDIDKLNLDKNSYCIIASGAMLMYGLCDECNDIDIKTTKELFESLSREYVVVTFLSILTMARDNEIILDTQAKFGNEDINWQI